MSDAPSTRPGQATLAVGLIGVGSLLVVATAWERIAGLQTIPVQDQLSRMAADDPFGGGMSAESLATMLRVFAMIGGGAAAAAGVLAFQVWQRSASARIVLTCLAPLLFVGWLGTSGFFEPIVLSGIVLLWMAPTRDWYAGRDWQAALLERGGYGRAERPNPFAAPPRSTDPTDPSQPPPPAPPRLPIAPPPASGDGGPPWASAPPPMPYPHQWSASAYPPLRGAQRPGALIWACVITWIATAMVAGSLALTSLLVLADDPVLNDALVSSGRSLAEIRSAVLVTAAIAVPLSVLAAGLAIGVMIGRPAWARIGLAACSSFTGIACIFLTFVSLPVVVPGLAALTVAFLLARRDVIDWRPPTRR